MSHQATYTIAMDNEAIGEDILATLGRQRDTLIRVGSQVQQVDANLSRSRRVANAIYNRVLTNKAVLLTINILLVGILFITIYLKLSH